MVKRYTFLSLFDELKKDKVNDDTDFVIFVNDKCYSDGSYKHTEDKSLVICKDIDEFIDEFNSKYFRGKLCKIKKMKTSIDDYETTLECELKLEDEHLYVNINYTLYLFEDIEEHQYVISLIVFSNKNEKLKELNDLIKNRICGQKSNV